MSSLCLSQKDHAYSNERYIVATNLAVKEECVLNICKLCKTLKMLDHGPHGIWIKQHQFSFQSCLCSRGQKLIAVMEKNSNWISFWWWQCFDFCRKSGAKWVFPSTCSRHYLNPRFPKSIFIQALLALSAFQESKYQGHCFWTYKK